MRITIRPVFLCALLASALFVSATGVQAYCLTGVRWPDDLSPAPVFYNPGGKLTTGQCISASQMDSAVTGGISPWRAISYSGTTTRAANKKDGVNVVG